MSYAGLAIFDDGRLNSVIFLSNNADLNSNKDAPLKVGFAGGFLGLSLGGAPSVKYTYLIPIGDDGDSRGLFGGAVVIR